METVISSATKQVIISPERPTVLIGERINPSGKKKMQEALASGDLELIRQEAINQAQAGADIIDINVSAIGVNDVAMMPRVVKIVMEAVDLPVCLDTSNVEALAAGLKACKGKPLINSVNGEERSLSQVLPLAKEYGAAVIGLTQDGRGIPETAEKRLEIALKIVERAEAIGISRDRIIIDCLTLAVGASATAAVVTLETTRLIKAKLGVNMVLAVSNVSFGLPDRVSLNNAFAPMTIAAGITCMIVDAAKIRPVVLAADVLAGKDQYAMRFIQAYRQNLKKTQ